MKTVSLGRRFRAAVLAATATVAAGIATPAAAQDEPASDFTLAGSVGLYSQYRFRGLSLSDEQVALQGSLSVSHSSGFYAGAWASSLAGFGTFGGANVELDLYGGYAGSAGGLGYDIGVNWYTYPGTDGTDYAEILAKLSHEFGPVKGILTVGYVPDQSSVGSEDNWYFGGDLIGAIPNTPVTLKAHLGYSDGDGTLSPTGSYLEWLVGADVSLGRGLTLGIAYVDTDLSNIEALNTLDPTRNIADANIVLSLSAAF